MSCELLALFREQIKEKNGVEVLFPLTHDSVGGQSAQGIGSRKMNGDKDPRKVLDSLN